jgi:DNA (cytosine-5)-methyltransferase 1
MIVTHALKAEGADASEDGTGRGVPLVPMAFAQNQRDEVRQMEVAGALAGEPGMKQQTYVAFHASQSGVRVGETHATLDSNNGSRRHNGVIVPNAVRRLTPRECERLQGFSDDYTNIPGAADGPRYRAIGNSMATNVMHWIGRRIERAWQEKKSELPFDKPPPETQRPLFPTETDQ